MKSQGSIIGPAMPTPIHQVEGCGINLRSPKSFAYSSTTGCEKTNILITTTEISDHSRPSLSRTSTSDSLYSQGTVEIRKLDRALEKELSNKESTNLNITTTSTTQTPNPYENWECGFNFTGPLGESPEIPNTKADFVAAVKREIFSVKNIQKGLTVYLKAISSGVHHAFSPGFLRQQTDATHKTVGQLWQISYNLQDILDEVERHVNDDSGEVGDSLKEAVAHALPWIRRTRAILVQAHVFYKINYVLGSDKIKPIH